MNTLIYKLVVILPFENYQRGDEITDQELIKQILDVNHEKHAYDAHVRKVALQIPQESIALSSIDASQNESFENFPDANQEG